MRQNPYYRSPLILSIVLHVFVFAALLWHFTSNKPTPFLGKQSEKNIISAVAVNPQPINRPAPKPTPAPTPPAPKAKPVEMPKPEPVPPKPEPVKSVALPTPKPEIKPQPKPTETPVKKLEEPKPVVVKKKPEVNKVDFAKALQAQQAAELAAEKKKVEKAKEQERKKAEAAKLAKQKELEKQKKLAQEQLMHAEQNALQRELANEQQALKAANAETTQQIQSEIDKYKAMVVQAIAQNWIVPTGVDRSLSCELLIRVGPGGTVLSVQIARSSGDPGLDNSARTAVNKASPLPVPKDAELFDHFRQLRLTVKPENLVEG